MIFPFVELITARNEGSIILNVSEIKTLKKLTYKDGDLSIEINNNAGTLGFYRQDEKNLMEEQYQKIISAMNNLNDDKHRHAKGGNMKKLREWFDNHSDTLITVAVVVVLDHFLFNGSLRERLKELMSGLLTRCEKQLENK